MLRKASDLAVYVVVRVAIAVIQAMPLDACEKAAGILATLAGRVFRIRGHVVDENLRIAFPDLPADDARRSRGRCGGI